MKYKLGQLGTVYSGGTPSTKNAEFWDGDIAWITPKDLAGYSKKKISKGERNITNAGLSGSSAALIPAGSVLMSSRAPIGYVAIANNELSTNQGFKSINCDERICLNEYIYYWIKSNIEYIKSKANGSTFKEISGSSFKDLDIDVPDLETQQKIVRILSVLDQKIELINCENCTIENTLQSHFNNWIDNMKPIATVGLDEIAKYTNGLAMQKFRPGDNDLGLPVVKIKEMNSGISKDTERCTSELKEEYTVFPGDVLFAWSGTLCMKIWDGEVAGLNQHIFKVTSDEYPKWFYYFWTKKHLERFINIAKGKATTMGHIQRKELSLSKVLIPNEHELKKQDGLFKPLLEKIISNNSQRQSLIHLRDTILPKLMSGEINLDKVMTDE